MEQYYSRLVTSDYAFYPPPPYRGRGWILTFEDYPKFKTASTSAVISGREFPGKSVIIHAKSRDRAQYASDLVFASFILWKGEQIPFVPLRAEVMHIDPSDPRISSLDDADIQGPLYFGTMNIPTGCLIARKASYRRANQNAIFKYLLSQDVFPTSQFQLDPSHWFPSKYVFGFSDHHTRCASAVVIAYSVIEEISLEVRASSKRPSFIRGKWNPHVRQELDERLIGAGIDLSDPVPWTLRDTPTRIERLKPPKALIKAEWSGGRVRDVEMEIQDAIAYASWLRSKVSAHRLHEISSALSYYDVSNVQHLARRLLLEKLGFWGKSGEIP